MCCGLNLLSYFQTSWIFQFVLLQIGHWFGKILKHNRYANSVSNGSDMVPVLEQLNYMVA